MREGLTALEVEPLIFGPALVLVGVVVLGRARDLAAAIATIIIIIITIIITTAWDDRALLRHIAIRAGLHIAVRDVAAILGLDPDVVAVDRGAGGLAGDPDAGVLRVCLDDLLVVGARAVPATKPVFGRDGVRLGARGGEGRGLEEGSEEEKLHSEVVEL
jgi:hypothetical protein